MVGALSRFLYYVRFALIRVRILRFGHYGLYVRGFSELAFGVTKWVGLVYIGP